MTNHDDTPPATPLPGGLIPTSFPPAAGAAPHARPACAVQASRTWLRHALPKGALGAFWWQGLRTLVFMGPQWQALRATPVAVALLVLTAIACTVLIERLFMPGDAAFQWPSLLGGWFSTAVAAWACWLATAGRGVPHGHDGAPTSPPHPQGPPHPEAATLFALVSAQALPYTLIGLLTLVPMVRSDGFADTAFGRWAGWGTWMGLLLWLSLAQLTLLWRAGLKAVLPRLLAMLVLVGAAVLQIWMAPTRHWYPAPEEATAQAPQEEDAPEPVRLSPEDTEVQAALLPQQLRALQPPPPGRWGLYAVTFAPYGEVDVFRRESELVATLMQQRFNAAGRAVQLVNHADTVRQLPWATTLNLQRTLRHIGRLMKRDEDVFFLHLTSHGASNGELAAEFGPLALDPVTPQQLRRWLDEAGIRWRVISISACYSGSWIPALASEDTLVMTAADADHTSYGCGRRSDLTFFGRAMYDEELRRHHSFERAHAAARVAIQRREKEAGKDDGYSNPQIRMGAAIRDKLERVASYLDR